MTECLVESGRKVVGMDCLFAIAGAPLLIGWIALPIIVGFLDAGR